MAGEGLARHQARVAAIQARREAARKKREKCLKDPECAERMRRAKERTTTAAARG